jgi:hypothetical protein
VALVVILSALTMGTLDDDLGQMVTVPLLIAFVLMGAAPLFLAILKRDLRPPRWKRLFRLTRFALANGFQYIPNDEHSNEAGTVFWIGKSRRVDDRFVSPSSPRFQVGNVELSSHHFWLGGGVFFRWGFLKLDLGHHMPHMFLISKKSSFLRSFTLPFAVPQAMSLEGDFDKYFTLYAPVEYARDALYVFAPDLMAKLIDHSAACDVEIIDRWMYVYSRRPFALDLQATWERVFAIVDAVGAKAVRQTARYQDARSAQADVVAPRGRRLQIQVSYAFVIVVAIYMFSMMLQSVFRY